MLKVLRAGSRTYENGKLSHGKAAGWRKSKDSSETMSGKEETETEKGRASWKIQTSSFTSQRHRGVTGFEGSLQAPAQVRLDANEQTRFRRAQPFLSVLAM